MKYCFYWFILQYNHPFCLLSHHIQKEVLFDELVKQIAIFPPFPTDFLKKEKNGIIVLTPDRREEKYEYNVYSLSHVLFNADIDRWPEIQNKTLPQYILERLEMFQFNGEVFSDNT